MTYTPPGVIDADAHVIENDDTWDFLEPAEQKYRPTRVPAPDHPKMERWSVGGVANAFVLGVEAPDGEDTKAQKSSRRVGTPSESRRLQDVSARLDHMDRLGIDIQVLHSTIWLYALTQDPDAEAALARAYNRWLAKTWEASGNRLPWSCLTPTLLPDEAVQQLRWARERGAVAVFMRPWERDRIMIDKYFYPIFEEAERLDMSIAVHISNGNQPNVDYMESTISDRRPIAFSTFRVPTVMSCLWLLLSDVAQDFPKLRWGFIESSAQWLPWIFNEVARRIEMTGEPVPADMFEQAKIFVTAQTDDDIPWILKYSGENCLMIGTDYGHGDPSSDIDATLSIREYEALSNATKDNILYHNPKKLFALDLDAGQTATAAE